QPAELLLAREEPGRHVADVKRFDPLLLDARVCQRVLHDGGCEVPSPDPRVASDRRLADADDVYVSHVASGAAGRDFLSSIIGAVFGRAGFMLSTLACCALGLPQ